MTILQVPLHLATAKAPRFSIWKLLCGMPRGAYASLYLIDAVAHFSVQKGDILGVSSDGIRSSLSK